MKEIIIITILALIVVITVFNSLKKNEYPYSYYVAYQFKTNTQSGWGYINISRNKKVKTMDDITSMEEYIEKENEFDSVIIINYTLLKK